MRDIWFQKQVPHGWRQKWKPASETLDFKKTYMINKSNKFITDCDKLLSETPRNITMQFWTIQKSIMHHTQLHFYQTNPCSWNRGNKQYKELEVAYWKNNYHNSKNMYFLQNIYIITKHKNLHMCIITRQNQYDNPVLALKLAKIYTKHKLLSQ